MPCEIRTRRAPIGCVNLANPWTIANGDRIEGGRVGTMLGIEGHLAGLV